MIQELSITSADCMTFEVDENSLTIQKTSARDGKFFRLKIENRVTLELIRDALDRELSRGHLEKSR